MHMITGDALFVLGLVASVMILTGWINQIIQGYRTKRLRDVSQYLLILIGIGVFLWMLYGLAVSDIFIISANAASIVLMIWVYMMKRRYDRAESQRYQGW